MTLLPLDILTATIKDLQPLLATKKVTSVNLIKAYLAAIEKNNRQGLNLCAVIETGPEEQLLEIARGLDEQRESGNTLGPLHGIPLLIKDNIATDPELGMKTTAGSYALEDSVVKGDATVIRLLREAGAIILGKANMTEWANFRMINPHPEGTDAWRDALHHGWSGRGGPCLSAYNPERSPLGSSAGSAVAVSAGFAPAALGSETAGSICCPSDLAGLYSIKPTVGLVSSAGAIPITFTRDVIGPMTKNAYDSALLLQIIAGPDQRDLNTQRSPYAKGQIDYLKRTENPTFKGKTLGFHPWNPLSDSSDGEAEVKRHLFKEALAKLQQHGATVINDCDRVNYGSKEYDRMDDLVLETDFKVDLAAYLETLAKTSVHTLADVMEYNLAHKDTEMPPRYPNQTNMEKAEATKGKDDPDYVYALKEIERISTEALEAIFDKYQLNALIFTLAEFNGAPVWPASAAKWPIVTVPLGFDETINEPVGLCFIGRPFSEGLLIELIAAWEEVFPARRVPPALEGQT